MKRTAIAAAIAALLVGTAHAGDTEIIIYKQPEFRGASYLINGEVANIEQGLASEGSSMVVKGGYWEVCTEHHFQGDCYVIGTGEYPHLNGLNNRIVSARFLGTDEKHAQRMGKSWREARRDLREEWREARREAREERREAREERREFRQARGAVDLYGREGFRGRSLRVEDNVRDLAEHNFDGRASSLVIHEGTWQVCTEPRFRGRCEVLRPGEYDRIAGLDDRVSSLRQIR
jgi:hypothetical protein